MVAVLFLSLIIAGFHNQSGLLTSNSVGCHPHPRFYRILYKIRRVMTLIAIENFIDNASDADVQLCAKFGTGQTLGYDKRIGRNNSQHCWKNNAAKQSVVLRIQVRASSQTKGLERGWKQRARLFFLASHGVRLARFASIRPLRYALPISLLILRKKPTVLKSSPTMLGVVVSVCLNQSALISLGN